MEKKSSKVVLTTNNVNNIKSKKHINMYCAPSKEDTSITCFTKRALKNIIEKWNNYYSNNKIVYNDSNTKKELWNLIDSKLKNICTNEYCWTKQKFIESNKFKKNFRPVMPNKWKTQFDEWLNTLDIENVMKQYEKKYDDFHFIGPVPIDFDKEFSPGDCVIDELCKIKLKSLLNKGIKKLGIIFNLDPHDKPGSHWVSFFANFDNNEIYYFDSYGLPEPKEVTKLMKRLKEQGSELNRNVKLFTNNVRHQYKDSECGVYSIHFIIKLLEGNKYKDIINNKIDDDSMQENRNIYYLNEDNIQ